MTLVVNVSVLGNITEIRKCYELVSILPLKKHLGTLFSYEDIIEKGIKHKFPFNRHIKHHS